MGTRLFIGNLSYNVTEQELREAFTGEQIELRSVRVALDRETGRPRGFAFVETATDDGAKASIEKLSGRILQGRPIIVEEAQAKPAGPRPGGFGGGPPRPGGGGFGPASARGRRDQAARPAARVVRAASVDLVRAVVPAAHPATSAPRGLRAVSGPGASVRHRVRAQARALPGGSVPKRSVRPAPSPRSASGATGAGTARTTSSRRARGR